MIVVKTKKLSKQSCRLITALLLLQTTCHATTSIPVQTANLPCQLTVQPNNVPNLLVGNYQPLTFNCTCCHSYSSYILILKFYAENPQVAQVSKTNKRQQVTTHASHVTKPTCNYGRRCIFKNFLYDYSQLYVESNNVGRTKFKIEVNIWNVSEPSVVLGETKPEALNKLWYKTLTSTEMTISTVRKQRLIDRAFEWSAAFVACVLAMCMGCMTDFRETKPFFQRPLALIACLITQHILMPPIACGIQFLFQPPVEIGMGLIIMSTMPGGGLAHLTVYLMTGERHLSAAISFMNATLNLVMAPVWLVIICYVFKIQIVYWKFVVWLIPLFLSQLGGSILATCRNHAAQALLNWIGRPILLLASILIVTLGIYINHYAIDHLDTNALLCVITFIASGFGLGGLVGVITKQGKPKRKSIAAETACFACLMVIPAVRSSMEAPDNDLATIMPLAGTILTPTPIILYLVAHKLKGLAMGFIDKRKEKQSRHYSIVSSLAKMAEDVTAVSTPLVIEQEREAPSENQKITTL